MQSWIKIVKLCDLDPKKSYFISRLRSASCGQHLDFYAQALNAKCPSWSQKPGIAICYKGGPELAIEIRKNQHKVPDHVILVCVEVPKDADKRWRARKPVRRRY